MTIWVQAIQEANSAEPGKIGAKLEGMKIEVHNGGEGFMRADAHQFFQPIYIANLGSVGKDQPFDEEGTGWGWKVTGKVGPPNTIVPTSCQMNRPSGGWTRTRPDI